MTSKANFEKGVPITNLEWWIVEELLSSPSLIQLAKDTGREFHVDTHPDGLSDIWLA